MTIMHPRSPEDIAELARLARELAEEREVTSREWTQRDEALKRIAALEQQIAQQRWHKIADKQLPEHRQRVLIYDGETFLVATYHEAYGFTGPHRFEAPTYWMPLPAAPNEADK